MSSRIFGQKNNLGRTIISETKSLGRGGGVQAICIIQVHKNGIKPLNIFWWTKTKFIFLTEAPPSSPTS